MIDLYYWPTPNGHKVSIFSKKPTLNTEFYRLILVLATSSTEFLRISPNNRMPAIIDQHQLMEANQSQFLNPVQSVIPSRKDGKSLCQLLREVVK
jgi:hypothetical protein